MLVLHIKGVYIGKRSDTINYPKPLQKISANKGLSFEVSTLEPSKALCKINYL